MADVFLSYARSSAADAKRIATMLRDRGYSVWLDEELPAHRAYADVIAAELDAATSVLVLWSEEAVRSQWVRSEANRARETGKLVQLSLGSARLPMPFDQIQCADLRRWAGEDCPAWRSVSGAIASLVRPDEKPAQPAARPAVAPLDRRRVLIAGGAATALAAAGFAGWRLLDRDDPSPEAKLLLQKGLDALQANDAFDTSDPGPTLQAVALMSEAARADPKSATAWGGLAIAYAVRKRASPVSARAGLDARSRSAAARAIALDPDEPRALAALRLLDPIYRNWLAAERSAREAVRRQPEYPIIFFVLSDVLGSVGRWEEAASLARRLDRSRFLIAGADRKVIVNLWSAGDLPGADDAIDIAVQHWPLHPQIWRTRVAYLMYSGRAAEALALIADESQRPLGLTSVLLDRTRATAEALAGRGPARQAVEANLAYLRDNPSDALQVAQSLAALGALKPAFALLDGYYFGRGKWGALAPPGGDQDRLTMPLFQPPMRSLWRQPEFDGLLTRIGLARYWAVSGTVPDYRRLP